MGRSALAIAGTFAGASSAADIASPKLEIVEEPYGQDAWVFEDIFLAPQAVHVTPSRVVVRIEAELLGYIVEERSTSRPRKTWRTRKSYQTTRADAVIEAGRIAHLWLSRGYAVCRP